MIRRLPLIAVTMAVCAAGLSTSPASAHVLKTDGSIGAVLHIEPDDAPTTGAPTKYVLSFSDDNGSLDISRCACRLQVVLDGRTIANRPMHITDTTDSIDSYTFQSPGVYTLRFSGQPTSAGLFQPFSLEYLVRVTAGSGSDGGGQKIPILLWIGIGMLIGLVLLAAYATSHTATQITKRRK